MEFSQDLKRLRIKSDLKVEDLATIFDVSKSTIWSWEAGETTPNAARLEKIRSYYPDIALPKEPVREIVSIIEPKTFGPALRNCRIEAGLSKPQLAQQIGVTSSAIRYWEIGDNAPVLENYEKLLKIFPALKNAPDPNSQDIEKPVGSHAFVDKMIRNVVGNLSEFTTEGEEMEEKSITEDLVVNFAVCLAKVYNSEDFGKMLELVKAAKDIGLTIEALHSSLEAGK